MPASIDVRSIESDVIPLRPLTKEGTHDEPQDQAKDSTTTTSSSLPPIDGGRQAWSFLVAATLLEALVWGMGNSYGAFQDYHISSPSSPLYGSPSAVTSAVGTLINAGQYFAPFLFSGLLSAYPHRIRLFSAICLLISCVGLIGASINPTPSSVVALQGFLYGWGGGAFYLPAIIWLPQWFDEKRGLATGIMFLGSGVGGVIWPFVISALLNKVGFDWTMRCLCLIQFVLGAIIAFFLQPRLPITRPNASSRPKRRNIWRTIMPTHNSALNSTLGFTTITLQFLHAAAFKSISYYIAPYASSLGLSSLISTTVLAALNAASAVSYVLTGKLCDVLPHGIIVLLINTVATLLVGALFGLATSLASLLAFAILYGFFNGGFSTTISPMARQMARVNSSDSSPVFLEYLAWRGVGGLVGPLVSAAIYKPTTMATKSIWSAKAVYGSHGIGPVVIFTTVISGLVALLSIFIVNFRTTHFSSA